MAPPFELQCMDGGCIVVMRFTSAAPMNTLLDPISDRVDGPIRNRMGHNFPRDELTTAELQRVLPKQVGCAAQIGVIKGVRNSPDNPQCAQSMKACCR